MISIFSMEMNQLQMLNICVFHVFAIPTMCSFRTQFEGLKRSNIDEQWCVCEWNIGSFEQKSVCSTKQCIVLTQNSEVFLVISMKRKNHFANLCISNVKCVSFWTENILFQQKSVSNKWCEYCNFIAAKSDLILKQFWA